MTWLVLHAAILAMWPHEPGMRCAGAEHLLARQRLIGSAGVALVDLSTDGRVVAFASLARLTAADNNTAEASTSSTGPPAQSGSRASPPPGARPTGRASIRD